MKSALDLLAEACSKYILGVQTNYSIQPLIRLVQKGWTGPILDVVSQSLDWLIRLREYRHHLVHRLMPSLRTGHRTETIGSTTAKVYYPVVVPRKTPSFVPDTRAVHAMEAEDDHLTGLDYGRAVGTTLRSDGTEEVVHLQLSTRPSQGYVAIEHFVAEHLENFEWLFQNLMEALNALDFKPVSPNQGSG
ncbi:MAG: hypothetical protein KJI69_06240 [Patescibacteria group bacterium]|nr:hypothetical protein [Patescibacteria group bacterium]